MRFSTLTTALFVASTYATPQTITQVSNVTVDSSSNDTASDSSTSPTPSPTNPADPNMNYTQGNAPFWTMRPQATKVQEENDAIVEQPTTSTSDDIKDTIEEDDAGTLIAYHHNHGASQSHPHPTGYHPHPHHGWNGTGTWNSSAPWKKPLWTSDDAAKPTDCPHEKNHTWTASSTASSSSSRTSSAAGATVTGPVMGGNWPHPSGAAWGGKPFHPGYHPNLPTELPPHPHSTSCSGSGSWSSSSIVNGTWTWTHSSSSKPSTTSTPCPTSTTASSSWTTAWSKPHTKPSFVATFITSKSSSMSSTPTPSSSSIIFSPFQGVGVGRSSGVEAVIAAVVAGCVAFGMALI